jgi:hypothetical protein
MSILDRGRSVDTQDALKALTEIIKEFYIKEGLRQKTDLSSFRVCKHTQVDLWEETVKKEFGYDAQLGENVIIPIEERLVSHERKGRTEAMQTISTQLAQIMMHPQTALRRLFGMGE